MNLGVKIPYKPNMTFEECIELEAKYTGHLTMAEFMNRKKVETKKKAWIGELLQLDPKAVGQKKPIKVPESLKVKEPVMAPVKTFQMPKSPVRVQLLLKKHSLENFKSKVNYGLREDKEQMKLMSVVNACDPNAASSSSAIQAWLDASQRPQEIQKMMRFSGLTESIDIIPEEENLVDDTNENELSDSEYFTAESDLSADSKDNSFGDLDDNSTNESYIEADAEIYYAAKRC